MGGDAIVAIRPYEEGDRWLLERSLGDPSQMVGLNGPESEERIRKRHTQFVSMSVDPHDGCMCTIRSGPERVPVGTVGYWVSEWKGQQVWELGWFGLPERPRRGPATEATRLILERLGQLQGPRSAIAFPSIENHASKAICRKLGFVLNDEVSSEYPPGSGRQLRVKVWMLALPVGAAVRASGRGSDSVRERTLGSSPEG
jgi:RimJ/RimL family protein N-acetyltransferase